MRAGRMLDFIALLAPAPTDDPRFGEQPGWTTFANVWANVTPTKGDEPVVNQGVQTEISYTVLMRYMAGVDNTFRITYRGQTLEILSCVDPDGRRRQLAIEAKQNVGVS